MEQNDVVDEKTLPNNDREVLPLEDCEHLIISDGNGLAVIGDPKAVEQYLRRAGMWAASKPFELGWLQPILSMGGEAARVASDIAEGSGRWVKLTKKSASVVREQGFMDTKTPGSVG